jgi:CRP-like cAMP-binding protein
MHIESSLQKTAPLHHSSLLSSLTKDQQQRLLDSSRIVRYTSRKRIVAQGQNASAFYMVLSGRIKQYRISSEGHERVVDILQSGQVFAESMLFFKNARYPFFAETLGTTELIAFNVETFIEILQQSNATCFMLMGMMSEKINQYFEQVDCLTLQNAQCRLINFLLKQIPDHQQRYNSCTIRLPAAKCIIASWLSVQPETLSRQFKILKTSELIKVRGNQITINDIEQLKRLMQEEPSPDSLHLDHPDTALDTRMTNRSSVQYALQSGCP